MQVRIQKDETQVVAIIDLESFSTSTPHRDLVLSGNLNHWTVCDDAFRFPWTQDNGDRAFQPLRIEMPTHFETLEFKLYDSVKEEWIEPFGYLGGAYDNMEGYLVANQYGSYNVRIELN